MKSMDLVSRLLCLCLLSQLAVSNAAGAAEIGSVPRFEPGECAPSAAEVAELAHARCGHLIVAENRDRPSGRTIKLPVAIMPAASGTPASDPIVHFTGGPGGDVFPEAKYLSEAGFNRDRDVIIMAQRGTLDTEPELTCPEIDLFNIQAIGLSYDAPSTKALHLAATKKCRDRLVASGIDLDSYNTFENAADFADLKKALGISRWNVHGYSYGTDLALTFMREHPEGIRSVILDSVVPPSVATLGWTWTSVKEAFDNLVDACNAQESCRERYPNLGETFIRLVNQYEAKPMTLTVTPPQGGKPVTVMLDGGALIAWLVGARPPLSAIPSAIKELQEGRPKQIAEARALLADPSVVGQFGHGMANSIFCKEWAAFAPESEILEQGKAAFPDLAESVLKLAPQLPFMHDDCRIWDVEPSSSDIRQLTRSEIPTLVISGSFDMRTSPRWAKYAADRLGNATNIVVPGVGHWATIWSECAQQVVATFLDDPESPDTACVAEMQVPEFSSKGDELSEVILEGMRKAGIPGAIVGIRKEGNAPFVQAFGVRDKESGEPMATNLHMRIGSVTKTFTITAILQLVDQGKIDLDDPIAKYVDGVPRGDEITLRQLAAMRSGLFNYVDVINETIVRDPSRHWSIEELLASSFRRPMLFAPGTAFDYSNTNTVLLGLVVEKVSGQALPAYIEEHLTKPLGLTHTSFPSDGSLPDPYSQGYAKPGDGPVVNTTHWNPSWGWAAGQMVSTVDDLHKWTLAMGTGKLLSPELRRERDEFLPAPGEGEGVTYGLGIENDNGWIGHNGNIYGYLTFAFYLPAERTTMVVLLNSSADLLGTSAMIREITRIISPNNLWPEPPEMPQLAQPRAQGL